MDNPDRLGKETQAKEFEKRTKEIIQQQMGIIKLYVVARDKWWITKCDEVFGVIPPDCWLQDGCNTEKCACEYAKWQQLKKQLESNNG